MKLVVLALVAMLAFSSCTSSNSLGKCVGVSQVQDPSLNYELSIFNAALGIIFFEMIIPPIMVLHHETYCPVSVK